MPVIVEGEEEQANSENGGLNNKLVLLVILLILFHVGAFVSFHSYCDVPCYSPIASVTSHATVP